MTYIIWHNPHCRKSREALQILEDASVNFTVRKYLEDPPSRKELKEVLNLLKLEPIQITRTKEKLFKELGLTKTDSADKILEVLSQHPKLIERAIVIKDNKEAVLGRPPENIKKIF